MSTSTKEIFHGLIGKVRNIFTFDDNDEYDWEDQIEVNDGNENTLEIEKKEPDKGEVESIRQWKRYDGRSRLRLRSGVYHVLVHTMAGQSLDLMDYFDNSQGRFLIYPLIEAYDPTEISHNPVTA